MARFEAKREDVAGSIILRLHGALDGAASRQLQLQIAELDPRAKLVVDFSHLHEFCDYAVGVISHAVKGREVELRGLRTHQARMFEYFGVSTGSSERAYYTPEELLVA